MAAVRQDALGGLWTATIAMAMALLAYQVRRDDESRWSRATTNDKRELYRTRFTEQVEAADAATILEARPPN